MTHKLSDVLKKLSALAIIICRSNTVVSICLGRPRPVFYCCKDVAHVNGTSCEFDAMACLLSLTIYKSLNEHNIVIYHWKDCKTLYSMILISTKLELLKIIQFQPKQHTQRHFNVSRRNKCGGVGLVQLNYCQEI